MRSYDEMLQILLRLDYWIRTSGDHPLPNSGIYRSSARTIHWGACQDDIILYSELRGLTVKRDRTLGKSTISRFDVALYLTQYVFPEMYHTLGSTRLLASCKVA